MPLKTAKKRLSNNLSFDSSLEQSESPNKFPRNNEQDKGRNAPLKNKNSQQNTANEQMMLETAIRNSLEQTNLDDSRLAKRRASLRIRKNKEQDKENLLPDDSYNLSAFHDDQGFDITVRKEKENDDGNILNENSDDDLSSVSSSDDSDAEAENLNTHKDQDQNRDQGNQTINNTEQDPLQLILTKQREEYKKLLTSDSEKFVNEKFFDLPKSIPGFGDTDISENQNQKHRLNKESFAKGSKKNLLISLEKIEEALASFDQNQNIIVVETIKIKYANFVQWLCSKEVRFYLFNSKMVLENNELIYTIANIFCNFFRLYRPKLPIHSNSKNIYVHIPNIVENCNSQNLTQRIAKDIDNCKEFMQEFYEHQLSEGQEMNETDQHPKMMLMYREYLYYDIAIFFIKRCLPLLNDKKYFSKVKTNILRTLDYTGSFNIIIKSVSKSQRLEIFQYFFEMIFFTIKNTADQTILQCFINLTSTEYYNFDGKSNSRDQIYLKVLSDYKILDLIFLHIMQNQKLFNPSCYKFAKQFLLKIEKSNFDDFSNICFLPYFKDLLFGYEVDTSSRSIADNESEVKKSKMTLQVYNVLQQVFLIVPKLMAGLYPTFIKHLLRGEEVVRAPASNFLGHCFRGTDRQRKVFFQANKHQNKNLHHRLSEAGTFNDIMSQISISQSQNRESCDILNINQSVQIYNLVNESPELFRSWIRSCCDKNEVIKLSNLKLLADIFERPDIFYENTLHDFYKVLTKNMTEGSEAVKLVCLGNIYQIFKNRHLAVFRIYFEKKLVKEKKSSELELHILIKLVLSLFQDKSFKVRTASLKLAGYLFDLIYSDHLEYITNYNAEAILAPIIAESNLSNDNSSQTHNSATTSLNFSQFSDKKVHLQINYFKFWLKTIINAIFYASHNYRNDTDKMAPSYLYNDSQFVAENVIKKYLVSGVYKKIEEALEHLTGKSIRRSKSSVSDDKIEEIVDQLLQKRASLSSLRLIFIHSNCVRSSRITFTNMIINHGKFRTLFYQLFSMLPEANRPSSNNKESTRLKNLSSLNQSQLEESSSQNFSQMSSITIDEEMANELQASKTNKNSTQSSILVSKTIKIKDFHKLPDRKKDKIVSSYIDEVESVTAPIYISGIDYHFDNNPKVPLFDLEKISTFSHKHPDFKPNNVQGLSKIWRKICDDKYYKFNPKEHFLALVNLGWDNCQDREIIDEILRNLSEEDLIGLDNNTSQKELKNQKINYKNVQVIYAIIEQTKSFYFDKYFIYWFGVLDEIYYDF